MGLPTSLTPTTCRVARESEAANPSAIDTASCQVGVRLVVNKLSADQGSAVTSAACGGLQAVHPSVPNTQMAIHVFALCIIVANDGTCPKFSVLSLPTHPSDCAHDSIHTQNQATPQAGNVLLSEPFLDDPYFGRKVVLLCEHNEEGSFVFVLNNFVDIDVDEVMDELPKLDTRISVGGPVKNGNLYYLHTREDIVDSIPVVDGVFMGRLRPNQRPASRRWPESR